MKQSSFILIFFLILISFFGGMRVGSYYHLSPNPCDTIYVTKTEKEYLPSPKSIDFKNWEISIPERLFYTDTIKTEPILIHDTLRIPIHSYYYEQLNGRLRIWASGYNVSLDKWELDEQHTIISKQKRLEFKLGIGPGVIYSPFTQRVDAGMGIFWGLTYKF